MAQKELWSYCAKCCQATKHDVRAEFTESSREDYYYDIHFQVVECCGCGHRAFRKVFVDIESAFPTEDNEWETPEDVEIFPKSLKGHRGLSHADHLPGVVARIYGEVLLALREDARTLAGLGLRAIVEAVCNDLRTPGRSLEVRISKLVTIGHISKGDAERLHGIRFMGNDAAHETKRPTEPALSVALEIVEHLLASVYILEKEVEGKLESAISKFEKFEELLLNSICNHKSGDEYPLAQFLGRDLRRVKEAVATLERELVAKINAGAFPKLTVGRVDYYMGSKDRLQHFLVT